MKFRKLMAASLTAALLIAMSGGAYAGWWDKADDAQPVDLVKVLDSPDAYKGKEITFDVVFHEVTTFYNPYYTRFIPSQYVNFSAWPVASRLWREEDYLTSFSFLFLEKGHKNYQQLLGMQKYTRLRLTGYVQNTFKNVPWIEVRHIDVLEGSLTRDSLRQIILGDELAKAGKWAEAVDRWNAATMMDLPPDVLASVDMKRGEAFVALGRTEDAKTALHRALENAPESEEVKRMLAQVDKGYVLVPGEAVAAPASEPEPVTAKPVDENRYEEPPKAMPVPGAEPVPSKPVEAAPVEAPMDEPGSEPESTGPEKPELVVPVEPKTPAVEASPAKPVEPADPGAGRKVEPEPVTPVEPKVVPETPVKEPPVKEPVPKKKMSGPM
jgi:tetratricopeptide (TPR) repeat protein